MKKILVLSVSAGQGHVRAAEALVAAGKRWFPEESEVRHVDMIDLTPAWFRTAYKGSYMKFVNRFPTLWGLLYSRTDRDKAEGVFNTLRRRLESQVSKHLLNVIGEFEPDILISTHFLPGQVLGRWRRNGKINSAIPHWIVVTDFEAHKFWLEPGQTGYFTASEDSAFAMRRRALKQERILVSGIPIMPEFSDPISREQGAAEFNMDPARPIVLLMGGGEGLEMLKDLASELCGLEPDFQLVVLAGKNQELLKQLQKMASDMPTRLLPLGFTKEMPKLLSAADLVVSKPGGLTTCECLAKGKAMIAVSPIPGQEEANADYLLENGAALKATSRSALVYRVLMLMQNKDKLKSLCENALALGRPFAAKDIIETVLRA